MNTYPTGTQDCDPYPLQYRARRLPRGRRLHTVYNYILMHEYFMCRPTVDDPMHNVTLACLYNYIAIEPCPRYGIRVRDIDANQP